VSQNVESFGKYILLEKVAMGGMAEVYLAKNQGAGGIAKFVAMKRILPQYSENANFIDMFKTEARIAVNLAHSNIVSIHEFGVEKDQFFIVMDYVEGRNLRQILNKMKKSNVTFSIEQILYICKEIAGGLDHAHRCLDATTGKPLNIIHRDMSPQNVMVSFEGECKIVDFGIAKAETQLETTRAGELKGKFGYMSPEQAEGLPVDLRTDIFSLGIVLWELLANDRLFIANNEVNTLRKIRECQVPSLRKINPNIPQELERIVGKALAKDRSLRYQTSAALQRELSRFLNRQYPDFSPHDFSIFIKTLFASDILESRKKQIEYAKIEMPRPKQLAAPPVHEKTVVTETSRSITEATEHDSTNTNSNGLIDFGNDDHGRKKAAVKSTKPKDSTPAPAVPASLDKKAEPTKKQKLAAEVAASELRVQRAPTFRDTSNPHTQPLREGTVTGTNVPYGGTFYGTRSFSRQVQNKSHFTIQNIFIAVLIGAIVGFVATYFHNPEKTKAGFFAVLERVGWTPPKANPGDNGNDPNVTNNSSTENHIAITTKPAGATILVDGVPYPDTTPATIRIDSAGHSAKITLSLPGYLPYNETVNLDQANPAINVALQSEERGYLNITVVGNGQIYVNNKFVAASSPANNIEVPANQTLQVRVFDQASGSSDERMITVGSNKVQSVTLIPRPPRVRPEVGR